MKAIDLLAIGFLGSGTALILVELIGRVRRFVGDLIEEVLSKVPFC